MKVNERVVLVTGGNRGLGAAFVEELLNLGIKKVYVGTRKMFSSDDPRVKTIKLDITNEQDIERLAAQVPDINMLINNAGIYKKTKLTASDAKEIIQNVFETNVLGTLSVTQALAPVLEKNKNGIIANMLSVGSWMNVGPSLAYGISKAAELSLTNNTRATLNSVGIQVSAIHAGFIDTEMMKDFKGKKLTPNGVARKALEQIFSGKQEILIDEMSEKAKSISSKPIADFDNN